MSGLGDIHGHRSLAVRSRSTWRRRMAAKVMRLGLPRCVPTGTVSADADADQSTRQHTKDAERRVVRLSSAEVMIEVCAKTQRQPRESQRLLRAGAREARQGGPGGRWR